MFKSDANGGMIFVLQISTAEQKNIKKHIETCDRNYLLISLIWQCPGGSGDISMFVLLGAGTSGGNEKPRGRALEKNGDVVPGLDPTQMGE